MSGLPTVDDAEGEIASRLRRGLGQFQVLEQATLWAVVNEAFCRRIAWESPAFLAATFAIMSDDDDEMLDKVAELLWKVRHQHNMSDY